MSWVYKTFEDCQKIGNNLKSFVVDSLFVDADKRNFNFKSEDDYDLTGIEISLGGDITNSLHVS